jgi:hypothetical protein
MNEFKSIKDYLGDFETELKSKAPKHTGKLARSISVDFIPNGTEAFSVELSIADYGYFQDEGVNGIRKSWGSPYSYKGQMPPAGAFADYTNSISERFAIARSVYYNGIKPKHFIQPVVNRAEKKIADLSTKDIFDYIQEKWNE